MVCQNKKVKFKPNLIWMMLQKTDIKLKIEVKLDCRRLQEELICV